METKECEVDEPDFEVLEKTVCRLEVQVNGLLSNMRNTHAKIEGRDVGETKEEPNVEKMTKNRIVGLNERLSVIESILSDVSCKRNDIDRLF